jgi:hypothetical protein
MLPLIMKPACLCSNHYTRCLAVCPTSHRLLHPCNRHTTHCAGLDPTWSYMDYSPDACMTRFSPGQMIRMREMVETYRTKLVSVSIVDDFYGQAPPCTNKTDETFCNGRGVRAIAAGACRCAGCKFGYSGDQCQIAPCEGKTSVSHCKGRGQPVVRRNACVCTACTGGYTGDQCERTPCYGHTPRTLCFGRGEPAITGLSCGCTNCARGYVGEWCQEKLTNSTSTTWTTTTKTVTSTTSTSTTGTVNLVPNKIEIRSAPRFATEGDRLELMVAYSTETSPITMTVDIKSNTGTVLFFGGGGGG